MSVFFGDTGNGISGTGYEKYKSTGVTQEKGE
jgi:hypothetical protein